MSSPARQGTTGRRRAVAIRTRRRRQARLSLFLLAIFSVGGIGWLIAQSLVLDLEKVTIAGGPHTPHEVIEKVAALERGEPLLLVDRGAVARRVEALPWVADAAVSWKLLGTLTIKIEERVPVAWVRISGDPNPPDPTAAEPQGGVALIDGDGRVLDHRIAPPRGIPELVLTLDVPEPGKTLEEAGEGLDIAASVPEPLRGRVLAVDEATTGWVLRMDVAEVVRLGDLRGGADLREKWSSLEAVVERLGERTVYLIDVRAPSVPAVRAEKTPPTTAPLPVPQPIASSSTTTIGSVP